MQAKHESYLRAINREGGLNILTYPTHERFQSGWASLPHTFYLFCGGQIKNWDNKYSSLPRNHILLDGSDSQIKLDMKFDLVLNQNKQFGHISKQISETFNIPLITLEHTLPFIGWTDKYIRHMTSSIKGKINCYISEYSCKRWNDNPFSDDVRIIKHGIDTHLFNDAEAQHNDGKILSVMNDAINRTWCLGTDIYFRITKDLPVNPVGNTPGLSEPAKDIDDLIQKYKRASVFINCSTISPIPMSLLEAASCGCPIVTKATCAIPEDFINGENCWCSNDEGYLREKLIWCLENPEKAKEMGQNARKTIEDRFSLKNHLFQWNQIFLEVAGRGC